MLHFKEVWYTVLTSCGVLANFTGSTVQGIADKFSLQKPTGEIFLKVYLQTYIQYHFLNSYLGKEHDNRKWELNS